MKITSKLSQIVKNKFRASMVSQIKFNFGAKENLIKTFNQELDYEKREYKGVNPEEKEVFFKNSGFQFISNENSARLELKKSTENYHVSITYHARSPLPASEDEKGEGVESTNMTDFQVVIQKVGKSGGILVDAMVIESNININQVYVNDNINEFQAKLLDGKTDQDLYSGPEFSTLDENLQTTFMEFLGELGINDETAAFIEVTSLDKDQALYMKWLESCKNMLV